MLEYAETSPLGALERNGFRKAGSLRPLSLDGVAGRSRIVIRQFVFFDRTARRMTTLRSPRAYIAPPSMYLIAVKKESSRGR